MHFYISIYMEYISLQILEIDTLFKYSSRTCVLGRCSTVVGNICLCSSMAGVSSGMHLVAVLINPLWRVGAKACV